MKIVTPLLKRVLYPALSGVGWLRRFAPAGLAVVTYHGVIPRGYEAIDSALDGNLVSAEGLTKHLRLLKANYEVISPEDFYAWRQGTHSLPKRAVLLTCDDGLLNCLTDMLPILREQNVACLFFATGASAGSERRTLWYEELFVLLLRAAAGKYEVASNGLRVPLELGSTRQRRTAWWSLVKRLSQLGCEQRRRFLDTAQSTLGCALLEVSDVNLPSCRRFGLMNAAELRQLASAGMTIGAHTMTHPMLSQAAEDAAYEEISASRAELEKALNQPLWAFAYPFGDPQSVSPAVVSMPERAGFAAAFLNCDGGLGADATPFACPRIHVTADMSVAELDAQVSGFYSRLQRMAGRNSR